MLRMPSKEETDTASTDNGCDAKWQKVIEAAEEAPEEVLGHTSGNLLKSELPAAYSCHVTNFPDL